MKFLQFVVTGPPTADIGTFVGVYDDAGEPVAAGWWQHNGTNWVYVMPVEIVPRLTAAVEAEVRAAGSQQQGHQQHYISGGPEITSIVPPPGPLNAGMSARSLLREKVRDAAIRKKERQQVNPEYTTTEPAAIPAHFERCPSCETRFDPAKDELLDCPKCSEPKCTAQCLPDPLQPCVDCQALQASPAEGGFDASAAPPSVFQPGWTASTVAAASARGEVPDQDDNDDE